MALSNVRKCRKAWVKSEMCHRGLHFPKKYHRWVIRSKSITEGQIQSKSITKLVKPYRGASALQKRAIGALDDRIDQSGKGVRYMAASGGGMRVSGVPTHTGAGMRISGGAMMLSGQGCGGKAHHCGCGVRQSGAGISATPTYPAYPIERGLAA